MIICAVRLFIFLRLVNEYDLLSWHMLFGGHSMSSDHIAAPGQQVIFLRQANQYDHLRSPFVHIASPGERI